MRKEYGRATNIVDGARRLAYYYEFSHSPSKFESLEDLEKDIDHAVAELLAIKKEILNED
jgi:hypothetical protein